MCFNLSYSLFASFLITLKYYIEINFSATNVYNLNENMKSNYHRLMQNLRKAA